MQLGLNTLKTERSKRQHVKNGKHYKLSRGSKTRLITVVPTECLDLLAFTDHLLVIGCVFRIPDSKKQKYVGFRIPLHEAKTS